MNPTLRTTFGIINPSTHRKYNDIINAFIVHDILTSEAIKYEDMFYRYKQKIYILDIDNNLKDCIQQFGSVSVIISLQQRTGLNIAVARVPEKANTIKNNRKIGDIICKHL